MRTSTRVFGVSLLAWAGLDGVLAVPKQTNATFPSLRDVTLEHLRAGLDKGCFSSSDLVRTYLEKINEVNAELRVVTEVNPDALRIAEALDEESARSTVRGPLHGIPVLLKNNIATKDKMNNTAGSTVLLGATVPEDSTMARKLREAGAVILGKANLSQWANFRSDRTVNGWSAHGGQALAAYHAKQDPLGSSSGSAVATDLGLAFAALGTETVGSLLNPAQRSGVVAIKPTVGMTSRHLVIPLSEHLDTVGPMARSVRDAAHLLQALAGRDAKDNYTLAIPGPIPDFAAACKAEALQGARLGVPTNVLGLLTRPGDTNQAVELRAFDDALKTMEAAGATIVRVEFAKAEEILDFNDVDLLLGADFIVNLASYLGKLDNNPHNIQSLAELRRHTRSTPEEEFPKQDTAVWDSILDGEQSNSTHASNTTNPPFPLNNTHPLFHAKRGALLELCGPGGLLGALEQHDLNAVVLPTSMSPVWGAPIGTPAINVPMGQLPANASVETGRGDLVRRGPLVPFGLSFLGRRWAEADLIGLAYAFEQKTQVRRRLKSRVRPQAEMWEFVERCPGLVA